jgi:WD40 repeat protein
MACLISTCVKPASPGDYCVDLRLAGGALLGAFNSSNTVQCFSLPSFAPLSVCATGSSSVLSEIAVFDHSAVVWADRQGQVGVIDLRTGATVQQMATREEVFSIDCSGLHLATASDKSVKIFDMRNLQAKRSYEELFADENDVCCVRVSERDQNIVVSCSEDSLMAVCNVESIAEDDYTLINVEEPALKVGFCGENVFCVTINKAVGYNLHLENEEVPPEVVYRHRLFDLQGFNPELAYFIGEHVGEDRVLLGGSHE